MGWDRGLHDQEAKTESQQLAFFEQCYGWFLTARASTPGPSQFYRVGGTTSTFAGEDRVPYITRARRQSSIDR